MSQNTVLTIQFMIDKLSKEGLDVTIRNPQNLLYDHLAYFKIADRNSLFFYTGNDESQLRHLEECVVVCGPEIDEFSEGVTGIKTEDPKLALYILAQEFGISREPLYEMLRKNNL